MTRAIFPSPRRGVIAEWVVTRISLIRLDHRTHEPEVVCLGIGNRIAIELSQLRELHQAFSHLLLYVAQCDEPYLGRGAYCSMISLAVASGARLVSS